MKAEKEQMRDIVSGLWMSLFSDATDREYEGATLGDLLRDVAAHHPEPSVGAWLVHELNQLERQEVEQ